MKLCEKAFMFSMQLFTLSYLTDGKESVSFAVVGIGMITVAIGFLLFNPKAE